MLSVPFGEIVKKICERTKVSEKLVLEKITTKKKELSGLVSDEGAAFIIASEMGVDILGDMSTKKLKIADVLVGMRSVSVVGRVLQVFDVKEFKTKDGKSGKVGAFLLGDETGKVRVVIWNDQVSELAKLSRGLAVRIIGVYSKENKFTGTELHLGARSKLEIVEKSDLPEVDRLAGAVQVGDRMRGVVVQAYRPNFYDVCPACGSPAKDGTCKEHGLVAPNKAMIMNVVIDDGEKCLRCVAFKELAEYLAGMTTEDVKKVLIEKSEVALSEQIEEFLLGRFVELGGKIRRNVNYERDEMVINSLKLDVDAAQILKELNEV